MNMQAHLLAALREELEQWEQQLAGLAEQDRLIPLEPSPWTVKDELAHLWAWQLRSRARLDAAREEREPVYPRWGPAELDAEDFDSTDQVNEWIYVSNRSRSWDEVYADWREGYLQVLAGGAAISERALLDSGRWPWMNGYSLADVLLGTYDHHQEHLEMLREWLAGRGKA